MATNDLSAARSVKKHSLERMLSSDMKEPSILSMPVVRIWQPPLLARQFHRAPATLVTAEALQLPQLGDQVTRERELQKQTRLLLLLQDRPLIPHARWKMRTPITLISGSCLAWTTRPMSISIIKAIPFPRSHSQLGSSRVVHKIMLACITDLRLLSVFPVSVSRGLWHSRCCTPKTSTRLSRCCIRLRDAVSNDF